MGVMGKLILWLSPYAVPSLTLFYPLCASIMAIESPHKDDIQQWLSYWIIYSFLMLFEFAADDILKWIPLWPVAKVLFACWLVLPPFKGAHFAYERFLQRHISHLLCEEEKWAHHHLKTATQTSKTKAFGRKQATFKRTAKVRKRSTRKILEFFGMSNLGS